MAETYQIKNQDAFMLPMFRFLNFNDQNSRKKVDLASHFTPERASLLTFGHLIKKGSDFKKDNLAEFINAIW